MDRDAPSRVVRVCSFAKVNLYLHVVGRRGDGYHELDTLFQTIGLHDRLEIELPDGWPPRPGSHGQIVFEMRTGGAPADATNLAHRAAVAYSNRWAPGLRAAVRLWKDVPAAAGLGGGSSNAGAVLRTLSRLCGAPESADELAELASELGSDVPYFLCGGTARARGRGDRIESWDDLPPARILVVVPPIDVSTPIVFERYRKIQLAAGVSRGPGRGDGPGDDPGGADGDLRQWLLGNDLEAVVLDTFPAVKNVYTLLQDFGLKSIQVSGSGGAVFSVVDRGFALEPLRRRLGRARCWLTETVNRADMNRSWSD